MFSMIWSVCASVDEDGRKKIDSYLREIEGSFPNKVRALKVAAPYVLCFRDLQGTAGLQILSGFPLCCDSLLPSLVCKPCLCLVRAEEVQ